MSKTKISIVIGIVLLAVISTAVYAWASMHQDAVYARTAVDDMNITANSSHYLANTSTSAGLFAPREETIMAGINWSQYPLIGDHRISESLIAEPNEVINHTFILVSMDVEVLDQQNVPEVYRQMSAIVKEERSILGEDSAPELWGKVGGMDAFHVGMLPFSNEIYRIDYYHPVNNLTWSKIDESEIG
jgi:hypothetical protein